MDPATVSHAPPKKEPPRIELTSTLAIDGISKLRILREWGEKITPRELYVINSCIDWVQTFPEKAKTEEARLNPAIHPYLVNSLAAGDLFLSVASINIHEPDLEQIDWVLRKKADSFASISDAKNKCLVIVLPNLDGKKLFETVDPSREIKGELLKKGIIMGEYYQSCPFETNFDPSAYGLNSPSTVVVFRSFVKGDWEFVWRNPKWKLAYHDLFGEPSKNDISINRPVPEKKAKPNVHHTSSQTYESLILNVCDSFDEMPALKKQWQQLLNQESGPFQTFSWNHLWYQNFLDDPNDLRIFSLQKNDKTIAIFPCYIEGRTIHAAGDNLGDYQEIIANNQDDATELLRQIVTWIPENLPKHSIHLLKCRSKGFIHDAIETHQIPTKIASSSSRFFGNTPFVSIEGGLEGYLERLTEKKRNDVNEDLDRLSNDDREFSFQTIKAGEVKPGEFDEIAEFYSAHSRGKNILDDQLIRDFLTVAVVFPESGLQIGKLQVDGEIIAIEIGVARNGIYAVLLNEFDKKFKEYHPVESLLSCRIEDLATIDGIHTLHLLPDDKLSQIEITTGLHHKIFTYRISPLRDRFRIGSDWIANKAKSIYGKSN